LITTNLDREQKHCISPCHNRVQDLTQDVGDGINLGTGVVYTDTGLIGHYQNIYLDMDTVYFLNTTQYKKIFFIFLDFYPPMIYMENSLKDCTYTLWAGESQGLF
jgi:hypothetical protein